MQRKMRSPFCIPLGLPALVLLTAGLSASALAAQPSPKQSAMTCTNPASGTSWDISIDYNQSTVDANPAQISDSEISWVDAKDRWNYTLDRKSGKLTVVVASSTGGYFLYDTCALKNSG
ncbi:MAG TPA: hypothetical protein VL993_00920 [Stellaceae bacterium]|nr:hypothetical protein [Stellaceae bacterium]